MLALVSVGVLIYFVHHVSVSIHADAVIVAVLRDLDRALASRGPQHGDDPAPPDPDDARPAGPCAALCAARSGYLQMLDEDVALAVLVAHDAALELAVVPGRFVLCGAELARVWPPEALRAAGDELRAAFLISEQRTPIQDLAFALDELVEIAVRALSPGINDPFTAATCVDWLCEALRRLATHGLPDSRRRDARGGVRIVRRTLTLAGAVDLAFDAIRRNAADDALVSLRLIEGIGSLVAQIDDPPARGALLRQAEMIERASRTWPEGHDRRRLVARFHEVVTALTPRPAGPADPPPSAGRPP